MGIIVSNFSADEKPTKKLEDYVNQLRLAGRLRISEGIGVSRHFFRQLQSELGASMTVYFDDTERCYYTVFNGVVIRRLEAVSNATVMEPYIRSSI